MATLYSTQRTNQRLTPPVKQSPTEKNKSTTVFFDYTGDAAQNDTLELVVIPKGVRIKTGFIDFDDFGTSVTLDIGDGTTEDKYLAALDIATAAGTSSFANTYARYGCGREETSASFTLTAKFEGGNPGSARISGWIEYVQV